MQKEELLKKRFSELSKLAYERSFVTYTDFLNLNELNILHTLPKGMLYTSYHTFGGYASAERRMAAFLPDAPCLRADAPEDAMCGYPMRVLRIAPLGKKFAEKLSHRDYLGAILNLGIDRCKIGDILVDEDGAVMFVQEKLASYLMEELTRIRHTAVLVRVEDAAGITFAPAYEEKKGTLASVRLDALLALAFSESRSRLVSLIEGGKIFVNGRLITTNSYTPEDGDVISARGYGKFIYQGESSRTKKGRIGVVIHKFI